MSRKQIWNMMMINACAAVSMAHYLLPQMKSSGKGLIVNMASAAAIMPMPFANIYGASKVNSTVYNIFIFEYYFLPSALSKFLY